MKWYYYLHENGDLIGKNPLVVDSDVQYFDSPFVKETWLIDLEDRGDAWKLVIEALEAGANVERIKELSIKWELTEEDLDTFIGHLPNPNKQQKGGMDLFIKNILGKDPDTVWDTILENHK